MAHYTPVTQEQLEKLGDSYQLLWSSMLDKESMPRFYIFGILKPNSMAFEDAEGAAREYQVIEEDKLKEFAIESSAIAVPVSGDVINYLIGSGLIIRDEEIAFKVEDGEIQSCSLKFGGGSSKLRLADMEDTVLAQDIDELKAYLEEYTGSEGKKVSSKKAELYPEIQVSSQGEFEAKVRELYPDANIIEEDGSGKTYGTKGDLTAVINGNDMQGDVVGVFVPEDNYGWIDDETHKTRKMSAAKKATSRIVKVLDENHNTWDDSSKESTFKLLKEVQDANPGTEFVSYVGGSASEFLIQVKGGPEAAYRYIAGRLGSEDWTEIEKTSDIMTQDELVSFLEEILETL